VVAKDAPLCCLLYCSEILDKVDKVIQEKTLQLISCSINEKEKSFVTLIPGANVIKPFTDIIYKLS